jgi:hypothetical protein
MNTKALVTDNPPAFYADRARSQKLDVVFPEDSVFEITDDDQGDSVQVILPDGRPAFVDGSGKAKVINQAWLTDKKASVYEAPTPSAPQLDVLKKGNDFLVLDVVKESTREWFRVRLPSGTLGFVAGDVKLFTDMGAIRTMAALIEKRTRYDIILLTLAGKGVPAKVVEELYNTAVRVHTECPTCHGPMTPRFRGKNLIALTVAILTLLVFNSAIRENVVGPTSGIAYLVALVVFFVVKALMNALLAGYVCKACKKPSS